MERRTTAASRMRAPAPPPRESTRPPARQPLARQVFGRNAPAATTSRAPSRIERPRAVSPTESLMSVATTATGTAKRKERDFDHDEGEATNINVVVRCRGRNDREVRENSAVVVSSEAVKGKIVNLSMGPNALSNKSYNFDRVFSAAADQAMIFDDVVKPILDEVGPAALLLAPPIADLFPPPSPFP